MSIFVQRERLRLWIGPDTYRALPASIYVGWREKGWRENTRPGHRIRHVWMLSLSWEWLPTLLRVYGHRRRLSEHNAAAWTGRDYEIAGCRWNICGEVLFAGKHRYFGLGRIWGADWL